MPRSRLAPAVSAIVALLLAPASGARAQPVAKSVAPAAATPGAATPATTVERPTLIVFITIDQMRPDYFTRFGAQLTGGLKRLHDGGAVFVHGSYDHAITETAPGHAVAMSGRHPASTGILLNDEGVPDPYSPLVDSKDVGASPYKFRGSALIDWMRNADSSTRALSVSRKDRGAILPLGRAKQPVFWYAPDMGFTTSRYYADTLPTWVRDFNRRNPIASFAGYVWNPLLPASAYAEVDSVPVENRGRAFTFPHVVPTEPLRRTGSELAETPVMDSLTLAIALDGLRALELGRGPAPDLLNISLSTTDNVGHRYGPDSRELHDQILRLDRDLGAFLDALFRERDSTRVVIALTADHGMTPIPGAARHTRSADPATGVGLVNDTALVTGVRDRLAARGVPRRALQFKYGMLRVERRVIRAAGLDVDSLVADAMRALRAEPLMGRVATVRALAAADTTRDQFARWWRHMLPPDEPVEAVASLKPWNGWSRYGGMGHNAGNPTDARVPVLFWGAPFRPGTYDGKALVVDMAPTLAEVLGILPTERVDGRVLRRALR
ncbi:MAG: alkaline phosphatase family protein [Gemmatirosa sp.]